MRRRRAGPTFPAGRPRHSEEKGSAPIEELLVFPALFLLVLGGLQFALYGLAAHATALAVSEGAAEARAADQGLVAGESLIRRDLAELAPRLVLHPSVSVTKNSSGKLSVISVSGDVPTVFPGVSLHVSVASAGQAESFSPG